MRDGRTNLFGFDMRITWRNQSPLMGRLWWRWNFDFLFETTSKIHFLYFFGGIQHDIARPIETVLISNFDLALYRRLRVTPIPVRGSRTRRIKGGIPQSSPR
ncbi:MAG TPA: hypothetical protein VFF84_02380 [Sphingobium sp.]|nr:hypothetical protein [Sphingobium sp.]